MPRGVYPDAFCSVSSMDLKLIVTQALVDGGAASDMPAGMGLCFVVFFVFFGASPDLASLDAIKNNQIKQVL